MFHRDIWQACRGYDERLIYWGVDGGRPRLATLPKHQIVEFSNYVTTICITWSITPI